MMDRCTICDAKLNLFGNCSMVDHAAETARREAVHAYVSERMRHKLGYRPGQQLHHQSGWILGALLDELKREPPCALRDEAIQMIRDIFAEAA